MKYIPFFITYKLIFGEKIIYIEKYMVEIMLKNNDFK